MSLILPNYWTKGVSLSEDDILILTIGRFKIYSDSTKHFLVIHDTGLNETYGCDFSLLELNTREEFNKVKKIIRDYLKQGKQLKLKL